MGVRWHAGQDVHLHCMTSVSSSQFHYGGRTTPNRRRAHNNTYLDPPLRPMPTVEDISSASVGPEKVSRKVILFQDTHYYALLLQGCQSKMLCYCWRLQYRVVLMFQSMSHEV